MLYLCCVVLSKTQCNCVEMYLGFSWLLNKAATETMLQNDSFHSYSLCSNSLKKRLINTKPKEKMIKNSEGVAETCFIYLKLYLQRLGYIWLVFSMFSA